MAPSTVNLVSLICLLLLGSTLMYSILLMFGGCKLFKKASKNGSSVYLPLLNLFTMLDICDMSTFLGILFFVPGINIIILSIMMYRLGKVFNCKFGYRLGLVFLGLFFFPLLATSDKQYKVSDEEYFKLLDDARGETIQLMTDAEINKQNDYVVDEVHVDSIFKSDIDMMEKADTYKATKIDLLGMEAQFNASEPDDYLRPIEEAPIPEYVPDVPEDEENKAQTKFTQELEKPEEVEYMDL